MNKRSIHNALALVLTLASLAGFSAAALAAGHGSHNAHGSAHTSAPTEQKSQIYTTTGTINALDTAALKATILHEPVPALNWPAMNMGFVVEDASLLEGLNVGDRVRFDFRNQGNTSIITDIEVRK